MATRVHRCITRLNVGGPTRHVAMLMEGLAPDRWAQTLVHGTAGPFEGQDRIRVSGDRVCVPSLVREVAPLNDWRARRALRRLFEQDSPAIVHTHQGKAGALARLQAAKTRTPAIVHTYHGHTFEGYFGPAFSRAVRVVERRAARVSDALICQSASQERDVLRALGRSAEGRTRVIPPAIDAAPVIAARSRRHQVRESLGIGEGTRVVLLPARLVPIKRPELAVSVAAELAREVDIHMLIAGDGPLRGEVERLVHDADLEDRVRLLGYPDDLADLYAAADASLLTSRMEGTPLALLESLAARTPVVAPRVGGIEDLVGEHAELVDPGASPREYALALKRAFDHPEARREAAGVAVIERHAPARLCADIDALYRDLLRGA